ncbi:MAG: ATP-binding protein [Desulfomonilia bacterium]
MPRKPSYAELLQRIRDLEARQDALIENNPSEYGIDDPFRKNEEHFRDLVENSPTGISIVVDEKVVYRNLEQQRIFGPLTGGLPSIYERVHPDDRQKLKEHYQSTLEGHTAGIDLRFIGIRSEAAGDHATIWIHGRSSLIRYQGRRAILFNMMDVTAAREMERLLNIQDRMASLGHVAAGIAHEIRNPLSGINIYLDNAEQILEKGGDIEKLKEVLKKIQSASSKIESIIKRVMDFSKPSEPKLMHIDINRPIEDALGLSSVMLRKTGIEIITDLAKGLSPCIADSQLIEQVILNLITNAAEAMKDMEQGKKIKVSSSCKGNHIIVSVADSGPGVPADLAQKIFDPFFTTKGSSTGIGLSLCQRIIHDHKGTLNISSGTLAGVEFTFTIPLDI